MFDFVLSIPEITLRRMPFVPQEHKDLLREMIMQLCHGISENALKGAKPHEVMFFTVASLVFLRIVYAVAVFLINLKVKDVTLAGFKLLKNYMPPVKAYINKEKDKLLHDCKHKYAS